MSQDAGNPKTKKPPRAKPQKGESRRASEVLATFYPRERPAADGIGLPAGNRPLDAAKFHLG